MHLWGRGRGFPVGLSPKKKLSLPKFNLLIALSTEKSITFQVWNRKKDLPRHCNCLEIPGCRKCNYEPELRIFGKTFLPRANFSKLIPSLFFRDHIFRKRDPRKQNVTLCRWVIPVACIFLAHHPRFLPPSLSIPSSPFFLSPHFRPSVTVRPQYQPPRPFNCRAVHFFRNLMQRIQFWFLFFHFLNFLHPVFTCKENILMKLGQSRPTTGKA